LPSSAAQFSKFHVLTYIHISFGNMHYLTVLPRTGSGAVMRRDSYVDFDTIYGSGNIAVLRMLSEKYAI